ncbi:MAG: radical SAM protein [Methanosarcinales archaeon]|nr:MAG: radical SAM protein [Methanosarcinales archaeon]
MSLEKILEGAKKDGITREEALYLFRNVEKYDQALELFKVASSVRDDEVGSVFKLDGFMGLVTHCTVNPPCRYCRRSSTMPKSGFEPEDVLTLDEISEGARLIKSTGTNIIELGGGTTIGNDGKNVIGAVKAVRKTANLDIWVNVGPALSEDTLRELKKLGVVEVCSSFEVNPLNEGLFREVKPGDNLEARKNLAEMINEVGLRYASVLMCGLGESYQDRVDHMFYLKQFENFEYFLITWFHPFPGTPLGNRPLTSPLEAAKTAAIARLIFRDIDIHVSGYEHIPLWIMAGANRAVHAGASVHRVRDGYGWHTLGAKVKHINDRLDFINLLPTTVKMITGAGMDVEAEIDAKY